MTPFIEKMIQYLLIAVLALGVGYCAIQKYDHLVKQEVTTEILSKGLQDAQETRKVNSKADVSLAEARAAQSDSVRAAVRSARSETGGSTSAQKDVFSTPDPTWVRVFNNAVRTGW